MVEIRALTKLACSPAAFYADAHAFHEGTQQYCKTKQHEK